MARAFFRNKKKAAPSIDVNDTFFSSSSFLNLEDYLGQAAKAGHDAKSAVKDKNYDLAWGLYHDQKDLYMQHANRSNFTQQQFLGLDSSVHEDLANILRLGQKHEDAFINILYWVIAQAYTPKKRHSQKLAAYFNRCKYKNTTLNEVHEFCALKLDPPDYLAARSKIEEWRSRE